MRYTVTLTEFSGYSYPRDPDAAAVGVTTQVGEPFEVLAAVVDPRNDWRNIHPEIRRDLDGATVSPSELIEDARLSATSPHARGLWVNAMVTMISGWAYPWDDGSPIHPPPDCYWHDAARWWAAKVKQPPPEDLVAALAADPELGGYQIFVREACRLTEDRTEAPDP